MRETLKNTKQLRAFLHEQVAGTSGKLGVMAGHFMLGYDKKFERCVPLIDGCYNPANLELNDEEKIKIARIGQFPIFTFRIGAEVVVEAKETGIDAKLLLILDNISFMHKIKDNGAARNAFLEGRTSLLHERYMDILFQTGISPSDVEGSNRHPLYFPENWLRAKFMKISHKLGLERDGEKLMFGLTELGHCKLGGNCASEYMMFLSEIRDAGYRKLISFVPFSCREPVTSATEIAGEVFGWKRPLEATNIFIEGSEISSGVDTEKANFTILVSTH